MSRVFSNDYSHILEQLTNKDVEPRIRASVVIPTYNKRESLEKVLTALSTQTYPHNLFEVIVSDDGSTDGTAGLVHEYKLRMPYRLRIISHEHDGYRLSMTRNDGIRAANCEIVILLDADMVPVPELLARHMRWHHLSNELVVLGHRRYVEPEHVPLELLLSSPGKLWDVPTTKHRGFNYDKDWREEKYTKNGLLKDESSPWWFFCGGNVSFRREHAYDVGLFSENFRSWGGEDADFAHKLAMRGVKLMPDLDALALHLEHERQSDEMESQADNRNIIINSIKERESNWRRGVKIGYAFMRTDPYSQNSIGIIRWVEIAKALGRLGYTVDLISDRIRETKPFAWNVRLKDWKEVKISDYDALKTAYHHSVNEIPGIEEHDCVIARIAHVIMPDNEVFKREKTSKQLEMYFETQSRISRIARIVGLTTSSYIRMWNENYNHNPLCSTVHAATGVPAYVPEVLGRSPFEDNTKNAIYCGNLSDPRFPEVLNQLAPELTKKGINLYFLGYGHFLEKLDTDKVRVIPQMPIEKVWKMQGFADVGIAIATKQNQESESSKIPYYLRSGLPCVAEEDIGNAEIIQQGNCGLIVPYDDINSFTDAVQEVVERKWNRTAIARYAVDNLSWDNIAKRYDYKIAQVLGYL